MIGVQHTRTLTTTRETSTGRKTTQISTVDFQLLGTSLQDGLVTIRFAMLLGTPTRRRQPRTALVRCAITPSPAAFDLDGPVGLTTSVCDLSGSARGCQLGTLSHDELPAGPHEFRVVVQAADEPLRVELTVQMDMSLANRAFFWNGKRLIHTTTSSPWTAQLVLPARQGTWAPPRRSASPPDSSARVRLCIAADIERYSRFRGPEALLAQERFLGIMREARAHAGIDESAVVTDGEGDSQFAVLPSDIDESEIVPRLFEGFRKALQEANHSLSDHSRLRLRLAFDRGLLVRSSNGWVGTSTIAVHRLLDSAPLREALKADPDTDYAVITSRTLYEDVISHGYGGLTPAEFTGVEIDLPQKGFSSQAWLFTPRR
ncbi:hypothetical protein SAMN05216188_117102 [Lentzea xinjiangensis]|uniref:Guanylate cyclase domain-containing protein n=1 Tax=Lentzea xinjiangensis TaxID=402600 RepID=A0A1H9T1M1_9PSEU|nr:hypothetical protein [Lentzea xinjiangensis]SER91150.1 hypothetical protein SAMN05216188_117102 [Lentzea xinjiangensis]